MGSLASQTVLEQALTARTIQEYLAYSISLDKPSVGIPSSPKYQYYSPRWITNMAYRAIQFFIEQGVPVRQTRDGGLVCAIRMSTTIECVISFFAFLHMGHVAFPVATNATPEELHCILQESKASFMVDGGLDGQSYKLLPLPTIQDLDAYDMTGFTPPKVAHLIDESETAVMLHSSGTTGRPKIIPRSHSSAIFGMSGLPPSWRTQHILTSSWMYWVGGVAVLFFAMGRSGIRTCWTAQDDDNDGEASRAQMAKDMLMETQPDLMLVSSSFLIPAAGTMEAIQVMQRCKLIINMGGVLPPYAAERLTSQGAPLATTYGLSELPMALYSAPDNIGDRLYWDYVQPLPSQEEHLSFRPLTPEEGGGDSDHQTLFELVALPTVPTLNPKYTNSDTGYFHTGDIFVKHPIKDNQYRCVGRLRDQVRFIPNNVDAILITTRPYEDAIEKQHHELIDAAMVIGDQRPRISLLIFAKSTLGHSISDNEVRDAVWGTVVDKFPEFLQFGLGKDMIVVVRNAVVPRTRKGDIVRPLAMLKFQEAIDSVY